jgi:hypothetical protein
MKTIDYQFSSESFYIPTWEVQHLFVGRFNPEYTSFLPNSHHFRIRDQRLANPRHMVLHDHGQA